jgi:hypothetical protein
MAHSNYLRQMARLLRVEQQLSVDRLALRLALPRSTIYYWVRDLPLRRGEGEGPAPGGGRALDAVETVAVEEAPGGRSATGTGRSRGRASGSSRSSEAAYEEGLRSFEDLQAQPTFRDFVCLYVARGCMRERSKVSMSDSDPAVIRLANRWMLRLSEQAPLRSLRYEPDQSLSELRRFWASIVGVEARTIRVQGADVGGAERRERRARHGVLTLTIDDVLLRARLQAWIGKTRDSWR